VALALVLSVTGAPALAGGPTEATGEPAIPVFVDETIASGLDHVNSYVATPESPGGGWEFIVGGGLAVFDCDDDEFPDLYLAGGSSPASLYRNRSALGGPLAFERLASPATDLVHVTGAYPLDIDSDGLVDLAVLRRGENVLLRGVGGCVFERANDAFGIPGGADWTTAFSATWEPEAAIPTVAFGSYQALDEAGDLVPGSCADHRLLRPGADGQRYGPIIDLTPGHCTLSMLFSDWDRSGRRDLRVSNDRQYYVAAGEEQLWRVEPTRPPRPYGAEDGWDRVMIFGMGIASQDVSGDGVPEIYLTSMGHNKLQTLVGGPDRPEYRDIARDVGASSGRAVAGSDARPSTSWHPEWDDVNNDGVSDLYVSKGNLDAQPDHALVDPSSLLLGRPDGTFVERSAESGLANDARARGAAVVDLNLDGLLDLVEVNLGEPAEVWRNAGAGTPQTPRPMGHWLAVVPAQDQTNRNAVGAWLEVRTADGVQTREVTVGGGHVSGALGPVHFGLGEATAAEVRVIWPDGEVGEWLTVEPDRYVRIERGAEAPVALTTAAVLTGALPLVHPSAEGPVLPPVPTVDPATCVPVADGDKTVARRWDEALLDAIRRDFPAPTVHARNLYHASAAMWDAWAAYDPVAVGVFFTGKATAEDLAAARDEAISYAAYRVLVHRYRDSAGGPESLRAFDQLMADLCYPWAVTAAEQDAPAAVGDRVAATIIEATGDDGSLEAQGYTTRDYAAVNEPMIVQQPGTTMADPNRWQPLALEISYTQNGQLLPIGPQEFIGPHWGEVSTFALPEGSVPGLPIDPGDPPYLHDPATDAEFKAKAVEVIRYSSTLDPRDGVTVDISPATWGNAPLGTNDRTGYELNPWTGLPYEPLVVPRADFGRVLAEFWADGPASETPPGHWNTIANAVVDHPAFQPRIGGQGKPVDPLEWDVKMYLALNGAVHDAAVAAWGAKSHYDYARPISMIRWMGGLGQSSDPSLPSYHPDGLPLIPGEVELITAESAAPGERHAHLAEYVGEIAIRAWAGNPADRETELGGVDWIRAVEWVPYQQSTFVTPAFAGYVSGHSTFSRAAAEVLTAMTGSAYFPGGLGSWTVPAGSLEFERGPSQDIELQWATYYDAADQAGLSRLYGGIHVEADDLRGRVMGAQCGQDAWARAQQYWDGSARY
jgi:hypothetical protein